MVHITYEMKGIDAALKLLDSQIVKRAAQRAVARTASTGVTAISSRIRDRYKLKKVDIDRKIKIDLSGLNKEYLDRAAPEAKLLVLGEPTIVTYFNAREFKGGITTFTSVSYAKKNGKHFRTLTGIAQKRGGRSHGGGVAVNIVKGKTAKLKHSFIDVGKGGVPMVFRRRLGDYKYIPGKRGPVRREKLIGMKINTIQSIMAKPSNSKAVKSRIEEQLLKEMDAQLKNAIREAK
jgi:hypothetical protein